MSVLNPLGFLAEIKCGISLTSVSFIWGVGRLTFLDAGHELDLKGLSFNFYFFFPPPRAVRSCSVIPRGAGAALPAWKGREEEEGMGGCAGYLENDENSPCEMWLGVDLCLRTVRAR